MYVDYYYMTECDLTSEETRSYYAPKDNMPCVELRAYENMSTGDRVTPCINMEGNEQYSDPAPPVALRRVRNP